MSRSLTLGTAGLTALFIAFLLPAPAHAQAAIGSGQRRILGAQLVVSPANQTASKYQVLKAGGYVATGFGCYGVA